MSAEQQKKPAAQITVKYGELSGEGVLAGLTVAQAKKLIIEKAAEMGLPEDAVATVTTMDPNGEAWKQVESEQKVGMVFRKTDDGMQIFQGASKEVPDTYMIRPDDIFLSFRAAETPADE